MRIEIGEWHIRSFQQDDAAALARYANNRNVWRNLRDDFPHPYTPGRRRSVDQLRERAKARDEFCGGILERSDRRNRVAAAEERRQRWSGNRPVLVCHYPLNPPHPNPLPRWEEGTRWAAESGCSLAVDGAGDEQVVQVRLAQGLADSLLDLGRWAALAADQLGHVSRG